MVIDNSKEKERLNKQISAIKTSLEEHFGLKLFQDSVGEDELPDDFNYFILETGELDIISLIQNRSIRFQRMDPNHLKLENQDRYIDQLVFTFRRLLKSDCHG